MITAVYRQKQGLRMDIRELSTQSDFEAIYPLIVQLNKDMTVAVFRERLSAMREKGYRCIAACEGEKILGIAGFWVGTKFWCGKYIDMDNVVVDEAARGRNIGEALVQWVLAEGRRLGCDLAGLDCYVTHHGAHRFYFRQGYRILGYHFAQELKQ
jgi:GNAT superfamily N-acetyltransferase